MIIDRRDTLGLIAASVASGAAPAFGRRARARLFYGGDIVTMEGDAPRQVEALVELGGQIVHVGSLDHARRRFPGAINHALHGQTLLPGFIDGHGHLYQTGLSALMANVLPSPDGPGRDFDSLVVATRNWMDSPGGKLFIANFGWIVANGYDDSQLREQAHPNAEILDRISTALPVLAIHQSGHVGAVNSRGLALAGYTRDTPNPPGGVIRRKADGDPDGVLEESAFIPVALKLLKQSTPRVEQAALVAGQALYVRGGYTTAQDGHTFPDITRVLEAAAESGALQFDVVSYPSIVANSAALTGKFHHPDGSYRGNYRVGGAKLMLDGSPQAKTAWLTHPYLHPPEGLPADYHGYAAMTDDKATALARKAVDARWQLICHCNGDAAIDQFIMAMDRALSANGYPDHRSVLIHGQTLRKDQVTALARLRILPSLFPSHTFYWGDYHRQSTLGEERAARISPCRDVLRAGLTLTTHHDAPVTMPDAMRVLDSAVNRATRSGFVLGPDQRLTPYEGLKALTEWAAIQHFEERNKGTLSVGKTADLTVLSANPLNVQPSTIHEIQVREVFKSGRQLNPGGSA